MSKTWIVFITVLLITEAEVGDIFFTGTSTTSSSHTGIVVEVSSTQITVVDGNWSDKVSRHTYNLTDSSLIGFASPIY